MLRKRKAEMNTMKREKASKKSSDAPKRPATSFFVFMYFLFLFLLRFALPRLHMKSFLFFDFLLIFVYSDFVLSSCDKSQGGV